MRLSFERNGFSRMKAGRTSIAAIVALQFVCPWPGNAQSGGDVVAATDFPFLIYCEYEGLHHAYYFARVGPDGRAIYITPDRQAGMITIDGIAERIGGDRPGSCADKTLEELRGAGQAFDVSR